MAPFRFVALQFLVLASTYSLAQSPADQPANIPCQENLSDDHSDELARLQQWLAQMSSDSPDARRRAVERLSKPKSLVLDLGPALRTPDKVAFQRNARPLVAQLVRLLDDPEPVVREEALAWLRQIGTEARASIPALRRMVRDEPTENRFETLLNVVPEDEPVGPILLQALDHYLERLTPEELAQREIHSTRQPDGTVIIDGLEAAAALSYVPAFGRPLAESGHTRSEVPYLLQAASHRYPTFVRVVALSILGELGEESRSAGPMLRKLMSDDNPVVSLVAACSLLQVDTRPQTIAFVVRNSQLQESEAQGIVGERALTFDVLDEDLVGMVIVAVQYGNGCQRRNMLRMLRSVPPDFRLPVAMLTQLRRLQSHPDVETRELAVSVLRQQGWVPTTEYRCRRGLRHRICERRVRR